MTEPTNTTVTDIEEDAQELSEQEQTRRATAFYFHFLENGIAQAKRSQEYWDLGGNDGPEPLYCLIKALQQALAEARELRRHQHKYDEDDYCVICGRDGRV